jgi:hypothetical protein
MRSYACPRLVGGVLLALVLFGFAAAAQTRSEEATETTVVADLTAADHEVAEGYFALGQKASLIAPPGTPLHDWLNENRGRRVRVHITVVEEPVTARLKK